MTFVSALIALANVSTILILLSVAISFASVHGSSLSQLPSACFYAVTTGNAHSTHFAFHSFGGARSEATSLLKLNKEESNSTFGINEMNCKYIFVGIDGDNGVDVDVLKAGLLNDACVLLEEYEDGSGRLEMSWPFSNLLRPWVHYIPVLVRRGTFHGDSHKNQAEGMKICASASVYVLFFALSLTSRVISISHSH